MADLNGYFQLHIDDKGTFLIVHAPQGAGRPVTMLEVENYLKKKKLPYSGTLLRNAINSNSEEPIKLQQTPYFKVNEETNLRVSEDRMSVIARLYPAAGGSMVSLEEIQNDLTNQGYKAQLDKESVESFLKDRKYCTDFVVAHGVPPEESEDGYVEYFFNTDLSVKPAQKEDGSVDFFNLKTVCECKEGDLLARLHPAKQGGFGIDVLGEHIQPRPVENVQLLFGKNVTINKERTELTANVSGHVRLTEGMVIVSDIYEVKDVDTSTGNIDYDGNLLINGNVHEGFTVKASGDIEVRGVVEGATVEAGGTVTVVRGINGNNVGRVTAGVNIISKYIIFCPRIINTIFREYLGGGGQLRPDRGHNKQPGYGGLHYHRGGQERVYHRRPDSRTKEHQGQDHRLGYGYDDDSGGRAGPQKEGENRHPSKGASGDRKAAGPDAADPAFSQAEAGPGNKASGGPGHEYEEALRFLWRAYEEVPGRHQGADAAGGGDGYGNGFLYRGLRLCISRHPPGGIGGKPCNKDGLPLLQVRL